MNIVIARFVMVLGLAIAIACGGGSKSQPKKCTSIQDCDPATEVCSPEGLCVLRECDSNNPCKDPSKECKNGLCVAKATSDIPDGISTEVEGADAIEEITNPPTNVNCMPCAQDKSVCGDKAYCTPLTPMKPGDPNKFCLKACTKQGSANECPPGFLCAQATTEGLMCAPVSWKCPQCAFEGCEQGKCCNLITGECNPCVKECQPCYADYECEKGFRCYITGGASGVCVKECFDGTCTDKFECKETDKGLKVCVPKDQTACGGCAQGLKKCPGSDKCVECCNSADCMNDPKGKFCCPDNTCCSQLCQLPTPYKCSDGNCHECCTDSDCKCSGGVSGKCQNYKCNCGSCGTCPPEFPACCTINGVPTCCECQTDADCKCPGCKCSPTAYSCVDSNGQLCGQPPNCGGQTCSAVCQTDNDCMSASGVELKCDPGMKVCYDPKGSCDNQTSCCGMGGECMDILSLLLGGGMPLPGMPGMPGGGGMPGLGFMYCTCKKGSTCLGGTPCMSMEMVCVIPIIGQLFCPGGTAPSNWPEGLCVDIMSLLGGLLGGGGGLPLPFP